MHETRRGVNWGKITIYFTYNDYNLYYYPVIGASACPESEPDCAPDEEGPVYVEFTGPTDTSNDYNAGFESWYQPVQEPFQLFSYPRTQAQLEASVGDVLTPVTDVKTFSTGNGISGTYSSNWTNEGTHTSSVASAAEQKQSVSVTVSAGTQDWSKLVGPGFRVSVTGSYAHSTSNRSIQLNTTKLGESSGLTGNLPGTFIKPGITYQYAFSPVIYGEPPAPDELDDSVSGVDISTHGILFGTFLADASTSDAGSFWKSANSPYNQPNKVDIALNHPLRWFFETRNLTTSNIPPECLDTATNSITYQCSYEYPPNSSDVWGDPFYSMRGLFITADAPSGPEVTQTTEGKTVYLQARIYNYSFQPMHNGWTLHVRFYRQPWNVSNNAPAGNAVLLNPDAQEIVTDNSGNPVLIPPYGGTSPNWVIAQTSFDTTGLSGQYFVFWAVAWAQDQSGNLVQEVDDHGLQSIPGNLQNIQDAPLQWVNVVYPSAPEHSGTTSFTNNVGFFRQEFFVAPATSPGIVTTTNQTPAGARLVIRNLKVSPVTMGGGTIFHVSADIGAIGARAGAILVTAEEITGGKMIPFESDLIPLIRTGQTHLVELLYHAESCGPKTIQLEVEPGRPLHQRSRTSISVKCIPGRLATSATLP